MTETTSIEELDRKEARAAVDEARKALTAALRRVDEVRDIAVDPKTGRWFNPRSPADSYGKANGGPPKEALALAEGAVQLAKLRYDAAWSVYLEAVRRDEAREALTLAGEQRDIAGAVKLFTIVAAVATGLQALFALVSLVRGR